MAGGFRWVFSDTFMALVLSLMVFYGAACFLLYVFQSRLLFFPVQTLHATPHETGLPYEAVTLKTRDGVQLTAWHVSSEKDRATLLFCHGNAGNISHRLEYLRLFHDLGLNTLIFDYRGFGASEGSPSEQGTYLDALAAYDFLVEERGVSPGRIVLLGESLGGAVAAWLGSQKSIGGIILQASFTSIPDLAKTLYPVFPVRWLARYNYNTEAHLKNVDAAVLLIHSAQDEIVPFRMGQRLYEVAKEPKEFLELQGDHNMAFWISREAYTKAIDGFIARFLPAPVGD